MQFPAKAKILALKKVFGNIQDANLKQSVQIKNSLVTNGAIEVLISILVCSNQSGPQFDFDQNIFQKGAPGWASDFVLQADAALALRRLLEVGACEMKNGPKRVHQAVLAGALPVLVPHLYCTSCAAQYASGALKVIAQYETYRENICNVGSLQPLLLLLKSDPDIQKSSFRNAAECLHLLSCSTTERFEEIGLLETCLQMALDTRAGEKPVLLSALCAANITAGQDNEEIKKRMEKVYGEVQVGVHLCRWLNTSLQGEERPYFSIRCSKLDMLRSVCLLATSEAGRLQLKSAFIKEDNSQKKLTMIDILMKFLGQPTVEEDVVEIILEILLHLAFDGGASSLKSCLPYLKRVVKGEGHVSEESRISARNILSVCEGGLASTRPKPHSLKVVASADDSDPSAPKEQEAKQDPPTASSTNADTSINDVSPIVKSPLPHVMISYSWAHQDSIIDICKHLDSAGLPYWLDIEQMHGEINDRMAEAIESCGVVIVGVSSKYKLSANCRMEAEYSNASGKQIIPLMMEKGYRADGWLGLLTAGKLWYGVSYDEPNRVDNISSMVQVVQAAVKSQAVTMSPEYLSRSTALFSKTAPAAMESPPAAQDLPTSTITSSMSSNCTTVPVSTEGSSFPVSSASSSGLSLDAISQLFDQMQINIQDNLSHQLKPIVQSLEGVERRLDLIEGKMSRLS